MDQQSFVEPHRNVYAFDGQTLIMAGIATVFLFVVFLVGLHVYARWWLRRGAAARRTHVFVLADNHHPASADRGLDPAVLSSLPVFTFSSKAATPAEAPEQERALLECAVCLSEFEDGEVGRLLPKCRHSFHIDCIDMWFHSHSTCPLCRSPVESLADRAEPNPVVVVEVVEGSSSGTGLCETCEQHEEGSECGGATSLARRRKAAGVKIEVAQPRFETELTQGSPSTRMLSFKRLLSMGGISPSGSRASPRYRAGTSRAAAELDLEGGLGEPVRAYTPKRVDSLLENRS